MTIAISETMHPQAPPRSDTPRSRLQAATMALLRQLLGMDIDPTGLRSGAPQTSGMMTMVPIFGPERTDIAPPGTGACLSGVRTYGSASLSNGDERRVAIVPLHIGFIQQGAQNHAFCRSAFIAPGRSVRMDDACCVQAAQGGYLKGTDQRWFFLLPLALRGHALRLRGKKGYNKLWEDIATYNRDLGLAARGHLEQILTRQRAYLTQYQSRFECEDGQIGALFLIQDRLVGVEVAPSSEYFRDVWMPLVCFAYGAAAMEAEKSGPPAEPEPSLTASSLAELRATLENSRQVHDRGIAAQIENAVSRMSPAKRSMEERHGELELFTTESADFAGQFVRQGTSLVYASLFANDRHTP